MEEGADVNFVFGKAYGSNEGYTPLMSACHRGRLEAARALLRSGADPNFMNASGDLTLFWAIDGGVELIKLLQDYGADLDARTPKVRKKKNARGRPRPFEEKKKMHQTTSSNDA